MQVTPKILASAYIGRDGGAYQDIYEKAMFRGHLLFAFCGFEYKALIVDEI
jgi:hypothetical protein